MQRVFVVLGIIVLGGCSGSGRVVPRISDFDVSPAVVDAVDTASRVAGAEGIYVYDDVGQTLSIDLTKSDFECNVETGILVVDLTELTATAMMWKFSDGGTVSWERVDNGTRGVVGIWKARDFELYVIIGTSGTAQIVGETEPCNDERRRNGNSCYEVTPSTEMIVIDGDLADWATVGQAASLSDPSGDSTGPDNGADVEGLSVAYSNDTLYVLMDLVGSPSTMFQARPPPNQGIYRLTVRGSNGLSLVERLSYTPETSTWATLGDSVRDQRGSWRQWYRMGC